MPKSPRLPLLAAAISLLVGACTAVGPSSSPSGSPGTSVPPSGDPGSGLDHPTGATDVVLRFEEGGGLMMMEWALTEAPIFTLYGDGTVVFRDPATQPPPAENGLLAFNPFRTARLSPEQVDSLLAFAIGEGGLAAARERYDHMGIADAGTATFTINAGGRTKTVSVYALGLDEGAPDAAIRGQFLKLAERLRAFDEGGAVATDEFAPQGWRAVLIESQGVPALVHPWPWSDLTPADFAAPADDPNGAALPIRVLTADQVAALGLGDLKGGLLGYYTKGPEGKTYSIPIRPLLPDEAVETG
jgi:hypothetical protein